MRRDRHVSFQMSKWRVRNNFSLPIINFLRVRGFCVGRDIPVSFINVTGCLDFPDQQFPITTCHFNRSHSQLLRRHCTVGIAPALRSVKTVHRCQHSICRGTVFTFGASVLSPPGRLPSRTLCPSWRPEGRGNPAIILLARSSDPYGTVVRGCSALLDLLFWLVLFSFSIFFFSSFCSSISLAVYTSFLCHGLYQGGLFLNTFFRGVDHLATSCLFTRGGETSTTPMRKPQNCNCLTGLNGTRSTGRVYSIKLSN